MTHMRRLLVIAVLAFTASVMSAATRRAVAPTEPSGPKTPTQRDFKVDQLEYYLNDDGIAYVRPGLKIKINSITIPSDRRPLVDFTLTDDFDNPIDRLGKTTPGAISLSFILSWYNPQTRQYTAYTYRSVTSPKESPLPNNTVTQASTDSGGTWTDLSTGKGTYKFKTALPADFDTSKTHTLGAYATRNLTDIVGKSYYANVEQDFRPDGSAVTETWDKIRQATSCNNCHNPLAVHGGSRRETKLCALCHQPQTTDADTGNTVDFKVMIHRIHRGPNLPSVKAGKPYQIIGFNQTVFDFSHTTFPQDIRNCKTCHEGSDPANKGAQADAWYTRPSRAACGSCHDDVNFATGENHAAGVQADDSKCATCHIPDSGEEFDASIKGAHTIDLKSTQLKGISSQIISVSNAAAGKSPTVVFAIKNADGSAVDGTKLTTFSPICAGPTTSYSNPIREDARATATFDAATGYTTYTFKYSMPADATGTWVFSADIYRSVVLKDAQGKDRPAIREAVFNPIKYVDLKGGTPTPRRKVVDINNCNKCHNALALHGGQRRTTEECVICHNPTASDVSRRPANAGPPESISFQRMVHRIHTGEHLRDDFTIYGFGGRAISFNEVLFPGDRRDCAKCHVNNSQRVPVPADAGAVTTLRAYFTQQGPGTAACLGCHDSKDAAAHAYLNTTMFGGNNLGEACGVCHGNGADWSVDKVHAR